MIVAHLRGAVLGTHIPVTGAVGYHLPFQILEYTLTRIYNSGQAVSSSASFCGTVWEGPQG